MIRVLVVDDHAYIRTAVTRLLAGTTGILVVGECADGAEVPGAVDSARPDVVLMDIQMPVTPGIDATRDLMATHPTVRVIMHTGSLDIHMLAESVKAGAVGFLVKGDEGALLIDAVRTVAAGGTAWPRECLAATTVTSPQSHHPDGGEVPLRR